MIVHLATSFNKQACSNPSDFTVKKKKWLSPIIVWFKTQRTY